MADLLGGLTSAAGDFEWTGLPGAPDPEQATSDGSNEEESDVDYPTSSYGNTGLWNEADGAGGNEGTGQSIEDLTNVEWSEGNGIDVGETLGLPDVPWKTVGVGVAVVAGIWLLRPYVGLADAAT